MFRVTGDDLKAFRLKCDHTQQSLANKLGVSRNTVARWERGEVEIPPFLHLALQTLERQLKARQK